MINIYCTFLYEYVPLRSVFVGFQWSVNISVVSKYMVQIINTSGDEMEGGLQVAF